MRKFLLVLLSVLMVVCLGAAFACTGDKDATYYSLIFRQTNGVTYECDVQSGYEVKEGTTVTFKISLSEDATGEPFVYANTKVVNGEGELVPAKEHLVCNDKGVYSVVMNADTEITVEGIDAKGEYNRLVYQSTPGVSFISRLEGLQSGMVVRAGTKVSFTIVIGEGYQGNPEVYANGTMLIPDDQGVYSFVISEPTTVKVEGIIKNVELSFGAGDSRVRYYDEAGELISSDETAVYLAGDKVRFKVQVSVYYVQNKFDVLANTTILKPDDDGYYTVELEDDTVITVDDLELEASFTERSDGGAGTERSPFRLTKPIDLYQMAMLINGGFYTDGRYFMGYYSLEADIDMEGEQLYIIGDGSTSASFFGGTFNGNGHTISNFIINDQWIDQESYATTYITNVGLFGYVSPTYTTYPWIYDLHLDTFTVYADASGYPSGSEFELYVGSLIGVSFGADVTGCSAVNGAIEVTGGDNYPAYVGGLIGQQMSAYATNGQFAYPSGVSSCHTDVDIYANGVNFVYATGGITGLLAVGEEHVSAYIINCYSEGNVNGGLNAGGIVGYAAPSTSVINCYSTGDITAYSPYAYSANYASDELYHANAGGIAGRAGFNSVISRSFSSGEIYASVTIKGRGEGYAKVDPAAAYLDGEDDLQNANSYLPSIVGCLGVSPSEVTESFIRNTMGWATADWVFEGGKPKINLEDDGEKKFTVSFTAESANGTAAEFGEVKSVEVDSIYTTMSSWYTFEKGGIPEFVDGRGGNRSYGYFFDSALTQRVPYAFIPTDDITLYVGYADYTEVVGTYYFGDEVDSLARLELNADGTYVYRNGALFNSSTYTYDGTNIVFIYSYLGELSDALNFVEEQYREYYLSSLYTFGATVKDGKIFISGGYVQEVVYTTVVEVVEGTVYTSEVLTSTGNTFYMFDKDAPLVGVKRIENFKYGEYFAGDNGYTYAFNGNGTGLRTVNGIPTAFTFAEGANNTLTVRYADGTTATAYLSDDGYVGMIDELSVAPYDGFTGTWERPFAVNAAYTFDGKGMNGGVGYWWYSGADGKREGTYTIVDGVLTVSGAESFTAQFNDKGFLVVADELYYKQGSFEGEWYYNKRIGGIYNTTVSINITLGGIGQEGYGSALAEYGSGEVYELTYHAKTVDGVSTIYLYDNEYKYAELTYDSVQHLLVGTLEGSSARLTGYDLFKGTWISDNSDLPEVRFNGNGLYENLATSADGSLAVSSLVYVNEKRAGSYSLNYDNMTATYTYRGVTYTLKYNAGKIEAVSDGGVRFTLQARDYWYGKQLIDSDGYVYEFNGRGELAGGSATASKDGATRAYTYTWDNDGKVLKLASLGSYPSGTITIEEKNGKNVFWFDRDSGDDIALTWYTPFSGDWIIGGEPGLLNIGKIYADNTAEGSYKFNGENGFTEITDLTYDVEGGYLSFSYNDTVLYINYIRSGDYAELSIGPDNSISGASNSMCIPSGMQDEFYLKEYTLYDEDGATGETLVFDGLSTSQFGSGIAVVYLNGEAEVGYTYSLDRYGFPRLISGYLAYYLVPWNREELDYDVLFYAKDSAGNDYVLVRPDYLYGVTAKDTSDSNITYEFNGVGGVTRHNANGTEDSFSYVIMLTDSVTYKDVIAFTAEDGTIYTATLDRNSTSSDDYTLTLNEADALFRLLLGRTIAEKDSTTAEYFFDGAGRAVRLSSEETVLNYRYEIVEITADGKCATLKFTSEDGSTTYEAMLDMSSENAEDWTVTLTKVG